MHWNHNSIRLNIYFNITELRQMRCSVLVWSYEADIVEAKRQLVRLKAQQWWLKLEGNNWSKNSLNMREDLGVMMWDSKREGKKPAQFSWLQIENSQLQSSYFCEAVIPTGKKSELNSCSGKKIGTKLQNCCLPNSFSVCGWLVCFSEATR